MSLDRPMLGIALMLGFCLLAPLADGIAKAIGPAVPLWQVVAVRFVAQAALLTPLVWAAGRTLRMPARLVPAIVLRTLFHVAGVALMFLSLRYLPLADAIAIAYVMPFVVLLLGWLAMGEQVGWRRLTASVAGFGGTLLVMQPSFEQVGLVVLLPLGVAVCFALFMLLTRHVAREIGAVELQAVNGLIGAALLLPALVFAEGAGLPELDPVLPDARALWLLAALAVTGTLAHLLLTWSLRFAPASTVAPMQYVEIPVAAALGWAMFAELPAPRAALGIAVVMAAGLYVIWREQALARQAAAPPSAGRPATPPPPA